MSPPAGPKPPQPSLLARSATPGPALGGAFPPVPPLHTGTSFMQAASMATGASALLHPLALLRTLPPTTVAAVPVPGTQPYTDPWPLAAVPAACWRYKQCLLCAILPGTLCYDSLPEGCPASSVAAPPPGCPASCRPSLFQRRDAGGAARAGEPRPAVPAERGPSLQCPSPLHGASQRCWGAGRPQQCQ